MENILNTLTNQIPVVVAFILFVLFLFREFMRELARRDKVLTDTINRILVDTGAREEKRDLLFTASVKEVTLAHNKGLARIAGEVKTMGKKLEAVK